MRRSLRSASRPVGCCAPPRCRQPACLNVPLLLCRLLLFLGFVFGVRCPSHFSELPHLVPGERTVAFDPCDVPQQEGVAQLMDPSVAQLHAVVQIVLHVLIVDLYMDDGAHSEHPDRLCDTSRTVRTAVGATTTCDAGARSPQLSLPTTGARAVPQCPGQPPEVLHFSRQMSPLLSVALRRRPSPTPQHSLLSMMCSAFYSLITSKGINGCSLSRAVRTVRCLTPPCWS